MNSNPRFYDYFDESLYFPKYHNVSDRDLSDCRRLDYNLTVSSTEVEDGGSKSKGRNKSSSKYLRRPPSRRRIGPWSRNRRYMKKVYQPAFYSDDAFYTPWHVKSRRPPVQVYAAEITPTIRPRRSSMTLLKRHPAFSPASTLAPPQSSYYLDELRSRSHSSQIKLDVPPGCRLQLGLRPIDLEASKDHVPSSSGVGSESRARRKTAESHRSNSQLSVDVSVEMEAITKEIDQIMSNNVLDIMMGQKMIDRKLMELMNTQKPSEEPKPVRQDTLTEEQIKLLATDKPPLKDLSKIPLAFLVPRPPKSPPIDPTFGKTASGSTQTDWNEQATESTQERIYEQLKEEVISRVDNGPQKVSTSTSTKCLETKKTVDTQYDEEDLQEFTPGNDYILPSSFSRCDDMIDMSKINKHTNWRVELMKSENQKEENRACQPDEGKTTDCESKISESIRQPTNTRSECTIPQSSSAESRPDVSINQLPSKTTVSSRTHGEPTCFKLVVQSVPIDDVNKLTREVADDFDDGGIPLQRTLGTIAMMMILEGDNEFKYSRGRHLNCFTEKNHLVECLCEELKTTTGFCEAGGDFSFNNQRISNNFKVEEHQSDEALISYLTINDVNDKIDGFTTMDTPVILANLRKLVQALHMSTPVVGREIEQIPQELNDALNTRKKTIRRIENQMETLESLNRWLPLSYNVFVNHCICSLLVTLGVTGYVTSSKAAKEGE